MISIFSEEFPWYLFFTILSVAWGASLGSFLNVCIYRIPLDLSVVMPGSHCPSCKKPIAWYQNIPIFAYLFLRGKCARCGVRISPRYVLVELLVALLFLLAWLKFDLVTGARPLGLVPITDFWLVPVYWLVVMGLVLGTFVDFEHMIIPDRVTLGGIACGLAASILVPSLHGQSEILPSLIRSAIGAGAGFGLLWGVATLGEFIFKKEAMGFGDVKLMGAIGAFFGWEGILFTVMVSSLAGSIVGISCILMGKKEMGSRLPFGPYLSLAALLWMYWGSEWWGLYVRYLVGS
ncbi:MAG: prepilin peptidase [Verrucomicrobia bacterium]|jgi:leader peptidase (prepilin peptidase) / N-methyltransferase|nr:prepilin peptidase [Verrucomicrobiota bacterium]